LANAAAAAAYAELPLPTTREEAWRFTDLRDFDPNAFLTERRPGRRTATELQRGCIETATQ